jgi:hypothetical protein
MLFAFGLILAICFVPGYIGAMIPTQWAVLSAILPLGLFYSGIFGPWHWLGILALAWASFSITWSPSIFDGVYGLWIISIWALAFWFGSINFVDHRPLWKGLALGLTISSVVAIFQYFGYQPVEIAGGPPAGLLYNSTVLGASCALVIIACAKYGLWFYIPGLLPGLYLSHSRGAWAVLGLTFLAQRTHVLVALTLLLTANIAFVFFLNSSDTQRLLLWGVAIREFNLFGHGIGSFGDFYYFNTNPNLYLHSEGLFRTEFAHNDYIQLWFELGIGALPIFAIYAFTLCQTKAESWPIFFTFAVLGAFYFPIYSPLTAFIGCFAAGNIIANWTYLRRVSLRWGPDNLLRDSTPKFLRYRPWSKPVPLAPST